MAEQLMNQSEIYKNRDAETTSLVAIMAELKYFDEQFLFYGTVYVENGIIKYRLNSKATPIYNFFSKAAQKNLCPTLIMKHIQMVKVPSGKEDEVAAQVRDIFVQKLIEYYPKKFFLILHELEQIPATDVAEEILLQLQDELMFCFEIDEINLFIGIINMAFDAKKIQKDAYSQLIDWCDRRIEQIQRSVHVIWSDKRYYYGFLYLEHNCVQAYSNADFSNVVEHLCAFEIKNVFCTPIFSKYYWFDAKPMMTLKEWRIIFEKDMMQLMDEEYWKNVRKIKNLEPTITPKFYLERLEMIDRKKYPKAIETLLYYGGKWDCR